MSDTEKKDKNSEDKKPVVGRTLPDLISEFPKTFVLFCSVFLIFIAFLLLKGYGVDISDYIKINPPQKEVRDSTIVDDNEEGENFENAIKKERKERLLILISKKKRLRENLKKVESNIEVRTINNQVDLINLEIEDIRKILEKE